MRFNDPRLALLAALVVAGCSDSAGPRFSVRVDPDRANEPLDGRLVLMLSRDDSAEPRFQIVDGPDTQLAFGVDVEAWAPGDPVSVQADAFGYPIRTLADVPPGEYRVQALLNRYQTYERADGHTVKLPPDRGEGQVWNRKPGNLYSTPQMVSLGPDDPAEIEVVLDQEIPPLPVPPESEYVKHVRIQSDLLTEFWGTPTELGAWVLIPHGFDEHPEARYPIAVFHGHFPYTFGGWREEPPDPDLECEYSARFDLPCYNRIQQELAWELHQDWTSEDFPRMLVVEIQHANPYYDDSYAVNSENLGPYGDAITYELIPEIERRFRGIGEGWARFLYGGSTGGWEAMAAQVFFPDDYNGAWIACPDPISFEAFTVVDLYEDDNAYFLDSPFKRTARPGRRDGRGLISATLEEMNHRELVLGTRTRSGQQWDVWEAVYSPVGEDGYPQRIWNKITGEINPDVAAHWRENYDLTHILRRDWATLGPRLEGKLHIYVGDMDNYYLNNAVELTEAFLESTTDPYYGGEVDYGDGDEHCWNGDHTRENATSRLRYIQMYAPRIIERIERSAPPGADTTSWHH